MHQKPFTLNFDRGKLIMSCAPFNEIEIGHHMHDHHRTKSAHARTHTRTQTDRHIDRNQMV